MIPTFTLGTFGIKNSARFSKFKDHSKNQKQNQNSYLAENHSLPRMWMQDKQNILFGLIGYERFIYEYHLWYSIS